MTLQVSPEGFKKFAYATGIGTTAYAEIPRFANEGPRKFRSSAIVLDDPSLQALIPRSCRRQRKHARQTLTAQLLRSCGPSVKTKILHSGIGGRPGRTRLMLQRADGLYTNSTSARPAQSSACMIQRSWTGMHQVAMRTSTTTRHGPYSS